MEGGHCPPIPNRYIEANALGGRKVYQKTSDSGKPFIQPFKLLNEPQTHERLLGIGISSLIFPVYLFGEIIPRLFQGCEEMPHLRKR
jgi:hypothetical protein